MAHQHHVNLPVLVAKKVEPVRIRDDGMNNEATRIAVGVRRSHIDQPEQLELSEATLNAMLCVRPRNR
jgi:hypothetical protein